MRYGIVIAPEEYALAEASGYDYVEFAGRAVAAMDDAAFEALRARVCAGRLPCLGLNAYCPPKVAIVGPRFAPEAAAAYACRLAPRAAALGVRYVGVGSPRSRMLETGDCVELAWRQAAAFLRETARAFAPLDITVCVEALGRCYCNFINTLSEAERLRELAADPAVALVLDFYNMEHSREADLPLEPYAAHIAHAHTSDDDGSPQRRSYLKPEKAALHAQRLKRLAETGYRGGVTLEIDVPFQADRAAQSLQILKAYEQEE